MSMICKCDRCDAIIKDKRKDGMALRVYDSADIIAGSSVKISVDLCSKCVAELKNFLNEFPKVLSVTDTETKSEDEEETYCTECPYFEDVVDDTRSWFGGLCKKDGHESSPSMYAIQSLHDDCPLKKQEDIEDDEKTCNSCEYHLREWDLEPCKSCNWCSNWTSKENKEEKGFLG